MDNTVNGLKVNITGARIVDVTLDLNREMPEFSVGVQLLTSGGQPLTTIRVHTNSFYSEESKLSKEDIPISIYENIGSIVASLKGPIMRKLNSIEKTLEYKPES